MYPEDVHVIMRHVLQLTVSLTQIVLHSPPPSIRHVSITPMYVVECKNDFHKYVIETPPPHLRSQSQPFSDRQTRRIYLNTLVCLSNDDDDGVGVSSLTLRVLLIDT